jgi:SAM-dependent methyltransferase
MSASDTGIRERLEGLQRVAGMDLEPGSHHYIVLSHLYRWLRERALPVTQGVMLDYGCGGQPYRALFTSRIARYIGADVAAAAGISLDIECAPDSQLPLEECSIDTILANQTLEHVPDPDFYLAECSRLLRTDGILIITAPMQWRHHEVPYDYLRFTRFGLTRLLERHGFNIRDLTPSGGVYALMGQIFLNHLVERGIQRKFVFKQINRLALWLDDRFPDQEDTINWMCIAQKSSSLV